MKHSEIIKKAKRHLWNGSTTEKYYQSRFICHAIDDVKDYKNGVEIKDYIKKLLKGCSTIEEWLLDNHGVQAYRLKEIQEYRLRFMDELIRRYKEVGK